MLVSEFQCGNNDLLIRLYDYDCHFERSEKSKEKILRQVQYDRNKKMLPIKLNNYENRKIDCKQYEMYGMRKCS